MSAPLAVRSVIGLLEDVEPLREYRDQETRPAKVGRLHYAANLAGLTAYERESLLDIAAAAGLTDRHAAHLVRRLER